MSAQKDITGQKFGRLTAIKPYPVKGKPLKWECKCECGKHVYVVGSKLRNGTTKSCGCYKGELAKKRTSVDLTGKTFGFLTVICEGYTKNNRVFWKCKCQCGNEVYKSTNVLTAGKVKSCNCMRNTLNGDSKNNLYKRWVGIHMRCRAKDPAHAHYYDRGICVCDEWSGHDGFINFRKWSLDNGYRRELTIDRIDNNMGYSPDNCRWTTMYEQNNNRSDNHYVTINGKTQSLSKWSKEFGLPYKVVKSRVARGQSDYEALEISKSLKIQI